MPNVALACYIVHSVANTQTVRTQERGQMNLLHELPRDNAQHQQGGECEVIPAGYRLVPEYGPERAPDVREDKHQR